MMKKLLTLFTLLGALITGCTVNQYHAKNYQGIGYSEYRLESDRFVVTYRGNRRADPEDVRQFALKRAAEVTTNYGYRYFIVELERDLSKSTLVKSTREEVHFIKDFWSGWINPLKNTEEEIREKKNHALELSIRCFASRPKEEVIDAYQFLAFNPISSVSSDIQR